MRLVCRSADETLVTFELGSITRIGRAEGNDILLFDDSAAEHHCEITEADGVISVRDLGSGNGLTLNGEPVSETVLGIGDVLRVGATEFTVEESEVVPIPRRNSEACVHHPELRADWRCSKCRTLYCSNCVVDGRKFGTPRVKFCPTCSSKADDLQAERSAKQQAERSNRPMDAWHYPLRGEGLILLIGGTIFFAFTSVIQRFTMLLSGFVFVFASGYILAYSQKIITTTAHGDFEPPTWPDFSDFMQDILPPFIQAAALVLLYVAPAWAVRFFLPEEGSWQWIVPLILLAGTVVLAPMAWLAVSMHDTVGALSPHVVIPSILRVPVPYFLLTLQLAFLLALETGLSYALNRLPIPILPWLAGAFVGLYVLMVFSRLLGVLYSTNSSRLRWF